MHTSVLLKESIEQLNMKPEGLYVDGTFGRGGHSKLILENLNENGRLIGIDKDLSAHEYAIDDARFKLVHSSFADIKNALDGELADGILLDLGVSSPQLDVAERGFSFKRDGPLDMRMDQSQGESVADLLTHIEHGPLAKILRTYGEEKFAGRIASAILAHQEKSPITRTLELQGVIANAVPFHDGKKDPATRSFQALRIYINKELGDLERFLADVYDVLKPGGRLVIIAFHSLEDRIVKQFMNKMSKGEQHPRGLPIMASDAGIKFSLIAKKFKPSAEEISNNVRSRSAILRCAEKV